jgi:hypothetical protein
MPGKIRAVKENKITKLTDSVATIEVTRRSGEIVRFLIDAEDIQGVKPYRWFSHMGYCCTMKNGRQWYLTWELLGRPEKGRILHHINRNPRDNRTCNLRLFTTRENNLFRRLKPNKSTGRRGISRYANGSFVALIGPGGRRKNFRRMEDAIRARIRFERSYLLQVA